MSFLSNIEWKRQQQGFKLPEYNLKQTRPYFVLKAGKTFYLLKASPKPLECFSSDLTLNVREWDLKLCNLVESRQNADILGRGPGIDPGYH